MTFKYEVALSFAGEDRAFAEAVAQGLREAGIEVFYDRDFAADLWGEDLSVKLREAYYAESRYCIMILSQHYVEKVWTNFERQQAIERLIEQKGRGYILPVRLDGFDGDVSGLSRTISYLAVSSDNPDKVVKEFLKKIRKSDVPETPTEAAVHKIFIPKLAKLFTDREKNQFIRNSFKEIVNHINEFAKETSKEYPHFEFDMEQVTSRKVIFSLYDSGREITRFKVWLGDMMGGDSIYLLHGSAFGIENDNSYNEYLSVEEHEGVLKLRRIGGLTFGAEGDKLMSPAEVAVYIWKEVCRVFS